MKSKERVSSAEMVRISGRTIHEVAAKNGAYTTSMFENPAPRVMPVCVICAAPGTRPVKDNSAYIRVMGSAVSTVTPVSETNIWPGEEIASSASCMR